MVKYEYGDRVAVYKNGKREFGICTGINIHGHLEVNGEFVHPKCCRRLVPKKKRELWVIEAKSCFGQAFQSKENAELFRFPGEPTIAIHRVRIVETIRFDGEKK